jgi:hypothetical protein
MYDGLFVHLKHGIADYTAEFNSWTDDPGIVLMDCSDGKQRKIPVCCVDEQLPEQTGHRIAGDDEIIFGEACSSN